MFEGVYTAIATPFRSDKTVDYDRLKELVEFQIAGGVSGIVPVGTTGESPTLNFDDHHKVIETVIEAVAGRAKVVAGTGGNATREAIDLTRHAKEAGADGSLQVTPYYNKPTRRGLKEHFEAVAAIGLPIMLYNVPGRSSCEIPVDLVIELAANANIVAVKEAAGDSIERIDAIKAACDIEILSGDDPIALPMMRKGAVGVVSVASNIIPDRVSTMIAHALAGEWDEAQALHEAHVDLFQTLFIETNPIPVKTALAMMGKLDEIFRLPMCPMEDHNRETLRSTLQQHGIISA